MQPLTDPTRQGRCAPLRLAAATVMLLATAVRGLAGTPVETGPRVAAIEISGNRRTQDFVIARELYCRVGDPVRGQDVERMESRLLNLELFSEVAVEIDSLSVPGEARLLVAVSERPAILPYPIASNSTKTGITVGAGVHHLNFRGRNERLAISGSGGGVRGVSASFGDPWLALNHLSVSVSGGYSHVRNRYDDFTEKSWSIGTTVGLYLSSNDRWRVSAGTSYVSLRSDEEDKTVSPDNHDRLHAVGIDLSYDARVLYRNPRRAWRLGYGVTWVGGVLAGNVGYTQYVFDVRRYQPVPVGRTVALHARLIRRAGLVPDYRLVRLGGSSSVRGYDGGDIEGRHGAVASVEYRFDLYDSRSYDIGPIRNVDLGLSAALFVDAGAAWDDDPRWTWDSVAASTGGGIRLFAPYVDVFRLDLAVTREGHVEIEVGEGMKF